MDRKIKRKIISRSFWKYLRFTPTKIRAKIVRSKFKIDYDLPESISFKLAESQDEIEQAFRLVHNAYTDLNYISKNDSSLYLTKFQLHPYSAILIIKKNEEVIGTLSIVPDSPLGLPSESTWNLQKERQGRNIAEVSSLAIKKTEGLNAGKLLLPFCKFMYFFSQEHLKLDGLIATTSEIVAPFYTDILLFNYVGGKKARRHDFASNNKSLCFFLKISEKIEDCAKSIYRNKPDEKNFYKYFFKTATPNFIYPEKSVIFKKYFDKKNNSISELLALNEDLREILTEKEKLVFQNIDSSHSVQSKNELSTLVENLSFYHRQDRIDIRLETCCFLGDISSPIEALLINISSQGACILCRRQERNMKPGDKVSITIEHQGHFFTENFIIQWIRDGFKIGCKLEADSIQWLKFINFFNQELERDEAGIEEDYKKVS